MDHCLVPDILAFTARLGTSAGAGMRQQNGLERSVILIHHRSEFHAIHPPGGSGQVAFDGALKVPVIHSRDTCFAHQTLVSLMVDNVTLQCTSEGNIDFKVSIYVFQSA